MRCLREEYNSPDKIRWVKSSFLTKNTDPTFGVRYNILVLQVRSDFSQSVTVRHYLFLNRVVPLEELPVDVITSSTLNKFKCAFDKYFKIFGCYNPKGVGFQTWKLQRHRSTKLNPNLFYCIVYQGETRN